VHGVDVLNLVGEADKLIVGKDEHHVSETQVELFAVLALNKTSEGIVADCFVLTHGVVFRVKLFVGTISDNPRKAV